MKLHYKIVGVTTGKTIHPETYRGEFERVEGEHPCMTALADAFCEPAANSARDRLYSWSGGFVDNWIESLDDGSCEWYTDHEFVNDGCTFFVTVGEENDEYMSVERALYAAARAEPINGSWQEVVWVLAQEVRRLQGRLRNPP